MRSVDLHRRGTARHRASVEGLLLGIEENTGNGHAESVWVPAKIKLDRGSFVEFSYNEGSLLEHVAGGSKLSYEKGTTPIVLLGVSKTYLANIVPATYAKAFREVVEQVKTTNPGKPYYVFEIINEPYFCGEKGSNASDYAAICKATYEEIEAHSIPLWPAAGGVILLCGAHLTYQKKVSEKVLGAFSDYTKGEGWMFDFKTAWPGSTTKVNGWTSHPYGEPGASNSEGNNNIGSTAVQHENAVSLGFTETGTSNWWVTEVGYRVGGGTGPGEGCTEATQSSKLKEALEQLLGYHNEGWLKAICVFSDGTTEWGIDSPRPAQAMYTAFGEAHGT